MIGSAVFNVQPVREGIGPGAENWKWPRNEMSALI